jgi:hypothetical protein
MEPKVQEQLFGNLEQFHQMTMHITQEDCPSENTEEEEDALQYCLPSCPTPLLWCYLIQK